MIDLIKIIFFIYLIYLFYSFYKHLFIMLMGLEMLMLGVLMNLINIYLKLNLSMWVLIYFMVFMVCDAVLGLTLLVVIIRFYSSDYCQLLSLNLW
uniref:NADH-ubiquinone oxidoreductase chain 4L n=1 Tax=Dendrocerus sp. ZJUH_2016009 TaxID=2491154 RepID=A0A3S8V0H1_9HYME|nr:NADH dehydrogenase subunit 4L [Dendrocerus sp. ZJUH_2016009]